MMFRIIQGDGRKTEADRSWRTMPLATQLRLRDQWKPDREICGYVLRNWETHSISNIAVDPLHAYRMDPMEQQSFVFENHSLILGMYHSHPSNSTELSEEDRADWRKRLSIRRHWIVTQFKVVEWRSYDNGFFFVP